VLGAAAAVSLLLLVRGPRLRVFTIFAALFVAGLYAQRLAGARLQSDGFYYFAYLRSIAFDRDVNFLNDYELIGLGDKRHLFTPTPTGHAQSAWTIGPAIAGRRFSAPRTSSRCRCRERGPTSALTARRIPIARPSASPGSSTALLGSYFTVAAVAAVLGETRRRGGHRTRGRRLVHALVHRLRAVDDTCAGDGVGRRLRLVVGGDAAGAGRHGSGWRSGVLGG
jgi:hypothetical protein